MMSAAGSKAGTMSTTGSRAVPEDNGFFQMMVFLVFQSPLQNQDCKIKAIKNQSKRIGKIMTKMVKSHKKAQKSKKKGRGGN
jgi:phage FluMu gp28-like protein